MLARLRARDRDAWYRLVKLYGPLVYHWCRRRGLKEEDAADVVQEVFRAVAGNIQNFQATPEGSFRGWLRTITRNRILDHYRRRQHHPEAVGGSGALAEMQQIPEVEEAEFGTSAAGRLVRRALEMIRPDFTESSWQAFWRVVMEGRRPADVSAEPPTFHPLSPTLTTDFLNPFFLVSVFCQGPDKMPRILLSLAKGVQPAIQFPKGKKGLPGFNYPPV